MYYYEMHCHERTGSACGQFSPEELVRTYASQGYTGIVVTNHFFNGNCAVDRSLPWKEKVERYCLGYELAKAEGEKVGLDVFFGFEYSVNPFYGEDLSALGEEKARALRRRDSQSGCDFLIYGLDKEWLLSKDESILSMGVNDFMQMVRMDGGTVVQAHPFRLERGYMDHISLYPHFTDGVETLNSTPNTMGRPNKLAKKYAKQFNFFYMAGSDAHGNDREYFAVTKLSERAESVEDIIHALKTGQAKLALRKNKSHIK